MKSQQDANSSLSREMFASIVHSITLTNTGIHMWNNYMTYDIMLYLTLSYSVRKVISPPLNSVTVAGTQSFPSSNHTRDPW